MIVKMCIHIEGFYKARVYRWQLKQVVKTELVAMNTQLTVSLGQALRVFWLLGQASKQGYSTTRETALYCKHWCYLLASSQPHMEVRTSHKSINQVVFQPNY